MLSVKKLIDPSSSRPLDKDVQYFLLTRLVEVDGELVVARGDDAPGAKHPVHGHDRQRRTRWLRGLVNSVSRPVDIASDSAAARAVDFATVFFFDGSAVGMRNLDCLATCYRSFAAASRILK